MKLLLGMNLPPKLSDILTNKRIETIHWYMIGAPDAADTEIMFYARDNDYVVVTHDLDFSTILSVTHGQKPSVIQIRVQNYNSEQFAELIAFAVIQNANELEQGAILSIDAHKSRLCMLPFL